MVVLVLGGDDDEHAIHVLETLRARNVRAEMFEPDYPVYA